jgi:hypothetical protein
MGGTGNLPVHPLLSHSPAIDAAISDTTLDQERDGWIASVDTVTPTLWQVFDRVVDGDGDGIPQLDLGAFELNLRWQTELLVVQGKGASEHRIVTTPIGFDRGAGTEYAAAGASGEFVTYVLPIAAPGTYAIAVGVMKAPNGGQFQLAIADDPNGPWTDVSGVQETYAPGTTFAELPIAASLSFAAAGPKYFRFTVRGRNAASSGYELFLDYLTPTKM